MYSLDFDLPTNGFSIHVFEKKKIILNFIFHILNKL